MSSNVGCHLHNAFAKLPSGADQWTHKDDVAKNKQIDYLLLSDPLFNAAQQVGGMVLMPLWGIVFGLAGKLSEWGPVGMLGGLVALAMLDVVLTTAAALTWRREEVLAHR